MFELVPTTDERIEALLAAFKETHVNGGPMHGCVRITDPDFVGPALFRSKAPRDWFRALLTSPDLSQAFPDLGVVVPGRLGELSFFSAWELEGAITHGLVTGGAYESLSADEERARKLARDYVDVVAAGDRRSMVAMRVDAAIAPWFCDIAWDTTLVAWNYRTNLCWVLFITDTD